MPNAVFFGYMIYFDYGHSSLIFVRQDFQDFQDSFFSQFSPARLCLAVAGGDETDEIQSACGGREVFILPQE